MALKKMPWQRTNAPVHGGSGDGGLLGMKTLGVHRGELPFDPSLAQSLGADPGVRATGGPMTWECSEDDMGERS